jgi:hypothetical protein
MSRIARNVAVRNNKRTQHSQSHLVDRIPTGADYDHAVSRTVCQCSLTLSHFRSRAEFNAHRSICQAL